ncbi:hypothetical protein [Geofilum rubicundum]|uniref:Alginate export domain-containing protein n=1 Tax=Geofilum rubicundum JCM 15548 TaxID=1236989 RepID=A0A0E9LV18_9BACT|nr:hypothetical protein [Geofilum rubicundum]GAO29417.1 hypothetical protein JCM15548_11599 [Geofilum rubicundum JCM 15548]
MVSSKKVFKFLLFFLLLGPMLHSQQLFWHPVVRDSIPARQPGDLTFKMASSFVFINNEFFGDIVEGYTLPAYQLEPTMVYYAGERFRLRGGLHLQQFFGENESMTVRPVISATVLFSDQLQLTMGAIDGHLHHGLSDALFHYERSIVNPVENGFQFRYEDDNWWGDAWMSWEQYIEQGDSIPEIFTAGISARRHLLNSDSGWKLDLPLQALVMHRGGQISDFEEAGANFMNLSSGLELEKRQSGFVKKAGWFGHFLVYNELKEAHPSGINKGHAFYTGVVLESSQNSLMLGYWKADRFLSSRGNPIFHSVSDFMENTWWADRSMLTGKLLWHKKVLPDVVFSLLVDGYYDLSSEQFDYAYGIRIGFTPELLITNILPLR